MSYDSLDPTRIIDTIDLLGKRIEERFPGAGLAKVCAQLLQIGRHAHERSRWIAQPILSLRFAAGGLAILIFVGLAVAFYHAAPPRDGIEWDELVQVFEAGINDVLLIGAAIFFLMTFERRIKRRRALAAIHELRSIAHIIDMHQLTKDPERLLKSAAPTPNSPRATMTMFELRRYLEYCSEMLSLVGKIATVYVQRFDDDVSLAAASEVEELTTGLSQKIWQKIMILHSFENRRAAPAAGGQFTVDSEQSEGESKV